MKIEKNKIIYKTINYLFPDNLTDILKNNNLKNKYKRISINSYIDTDALYGFEKREKKTQVIDLKSKSIEDIFAGFNSQTKNKINRSFKNDKLKFKIDDKSFLDNYYLYSDIEYVQGRIPESKKYFENVKFFSGYLGDELLANIGVVCIDDEILRVINISSKRLGTNDKDKYKMISIISRRIVYEICKYGIEKGFERFDFCGINFDNPKKKGIADFKLGFGGETVAEFIYIYKGRMMKCIEKLFLIKRVVFTITKKIKK